MAPVRSRRLPGPAGGDSCRPPATGPADVPPIRDAIAVNAPAPSPLQPAVAGGGTGRVTILLHLGAHKTATTLLQSRLRGLGGRVAGTRFTFLDNEEVKRTAWSRWCRGRETRVAAGTDPAGAFAADVATWASTAGGLVLMSCEDFLGSTAMFDGRGLYPEAAERIGRFRSLVDAHPDVVVRPLLYLRQTSGFLASCLSQEIAKGRGVDRRDLLRQVRPGRYRWRPLVEAIEAGFGGRLPVRRYETIRDDGALGFTLDFLAAFGFPAPGTVERLVRLGGLAEMMPERAERLTHALRAALRPNAALSERGILVAEAIRPHVSAAEWSRFVRPFLARHFDAVRDGGGGTDFRGPRGAKLDAAHAEDLAWLGDRLTLRHPPLAPGRTPVR